MLEPQAVDLRANGPAANYSLTPVLAVTNLTNRMRFFIRGKPDTAVGKMRGAGCEATPQRITGLRALVAERHQSLEIKPQCPQAGLVTVYWALDISGSSGIASRLYLGDRARYELAENYHHMICVSCGDVSEFEECPLEPELLPFGNGSEVGSHCFEVYGK